MVSRKGEANELPTTSIDTFFACTIIIAAVLISTTFLTSTLQTTIGGTQDVNKESYLKAIADRTVTSPGAPLNWGINGLVPTDFGLAESNSNTPFEIDADKITMLNQLNSHYISYAELATAAKLSNIALSIKVSPIMSLVLQQSFNNTNGNETSFSFQVLTSVDSEPVSASLHCYVVGENYLTDTTNITSDVGLGQIAFQMPVDTIENATLVVFARASCDDRITSYATYNFANSEQQLASNEDILTASPFNYTLDLTPHESGINVQGGYLFSFGYEQNLTCVQGNTTFLVPRLIDKSPFVILIYGENGNAFFEDWTSYPEIPLSWGSSFQGSEQNVFSYVVTIKDTLYKLDISLGAPPTK